MKPPIRLLLVDDHPVVRDGLRGIFANDHEFSIVGEAANGNTALQLLEQCIIDVVLLDLANTTVEMMARYLCGRLREEQRGAQVRAREVVPLLQRDLAFARVERELELLHVHRRDAGGGARPGQRRAHRRG